MPLDVNLTTGGVSHVGAVRKVEVPRKRDVLDAYDRIGKAIDRGLLPSKEDWLLVHRFILTRS